MGLGCTSSYDRQLERGADATEAFPTAARSSASASRVSPRSRTRMGHRNGGRDCNKNTKISQSRLSSMLQRSVDVTASWFAGGEWARERPQGRPLPPPSRLGFPTRERGESEKGEKSTRSGEDASVRTPIWNVVAFRSEKISVINRRALRSSRSKAAWARTARARASLRAGAEQSATGPQATAPSQRVHKPTATAPAVLCLPPLDRFKLDHSQHMKPSVVAPPLAKGLACQRCSARKVRSVAVCGLRAPPALLLLLRVQPPAALSRN